MDKTVELFEKLTSNIVEYIRYILVAGIALLSVKLYSCEWFEIVIGQPMGVLILGLTGFGITVYFFNRTFYYPRLEWIADIKNKDTFRNYVREIKHGIRFYQANDLWIALQDEGKVGKGLPKYKLWRASMEMMSGLSLVYLIMSLFAFIHKDLDAGCAYALFFLILVSTSIQSSRNFERRIFNLYKYGVEKELGDEVKASLAKMVRSELSLSKRVFIELAKIVFTLVMAYLFLSLKVFK